MTTLAELQQAFHDFLKGDNSNVESLVVGKNTQEVKRRLGIYQEAYQLRLESNLRDQYPILSAYLKEKFEQLAQDYRTAYPPRDFAIRQYGRHLAAYLFEHKAYPEFLANLAQFEWALNISLDESADKPLLMLQDVQQLPQEQLLSLRFSFHPSLQLLVLDYDIPAYWNACKRSEKLRDPEKLVEPIYCAVWRKELLPYHRKISHKEHVLYNAVMTGADFTGLCEAILPLSSEETAAQEVVTILMQWLVDGWCCRI